MKKNIITHSLSQHLNKDCFIYFTLFFTGELEREREKEGERERERGGKERVREKGGERGRHSKILKEKTILRNLMFS